MYSLNLAVRAAHTVKQVYAVTEGMPACVATGVVRLWSGDGRLQAVYSSMHPGGWVLHFEVFVIVGRLHCTLDSNINVVGACMYDTCDVSLRGSVCQCAASKWYKIDNLSLRGCANAQPASGKK